MRHSMHKLAGRRRRRMSLIDPLQPVEQSLF